MRSLKRRAGLAALASSPTWALAADPGSIANNQNYTSLIDLFNTQSAQWQAPLQSAAQALYATLIIITLVLAFIPLVLRGAELHEWGETLVKFILVTGFWLWMIHNYAALANGIINGFRHAAKNAVAASGGGQTLSPTDILKTGLDLVHVAISQASVWNLPLALAMMLAAAIIAIVFALVAGLVAVTLVESYVVINASVIFIAFAGLKFTSDIAMHAIRYAIGVGVKLFALQLIVGVSMAVFQAWVAQYQNPGLVATIEDGFGLAGLAILVFYLAVYLPPALMGIVTGHQSGGMHFGAALGAATVMAGGAAMAGASVLGGASAMQGAGRLASEQLKDASAKGEGPGSAAGRVLALAGNSAANYARAALQDVGARLGGRPGAHSGTMGGRMGESMRAQADILREGRNAPAPPASSPPPQGPTSASPEPLAAAAPVPGGSIHGEEPRNA
jgi:type IV secretion system protein TrbL